MADDLENTIRDAAADPASVAVDGQSVQARRIPELIQADQHLAARAATKKNHLGMTFRKLEPGGCG